MTQMINGIGCQKWRVFILFAFTNLFEELREENGLFDKADEFFVNKEGNGKRLEKALQILVAKTCNGLGCVEIVVSKKFDGFLSDCQILEVCFDQVDDFWWWSLVDALLCFVHGLVQFLCIFRKIRGSSFEVCMGMV